MDEYTKQLIENEKEWRRHLLTRLQQIDSKLDGQAIVIEKLKTSIRISTASFGALFGTIASLISSYFKHKG